VSDEAARSCVAKWHDHKVANVSGAENLDIGMANMQGFLWNLIHLNALITARMRNEQFLPAELNGTQQLDIKLLLAGALLVQNEERSCVEKVVAEHACEASDTIGHIAADVLTVFTHFPVRLMICAASFT